MPPSLTERSCRRRCLEKKFMKVTSEGTGDSSVGELHARHPKAGGGEIIALSRFGELRAFAEPWKRALLTTTPRCPTHLPAWSEATLASLTPLHPFRVLLGVGAKQLELILPLTLRSARVLGRSTTNIEAATELSPLFCQSAQDWLPRLVRWLDLEIPDWTRIEFPMVRQGDAAATELEHAARRMGLAVRRERTHLSPCLNIESDFDTYIRVRREKIGGALRNKREKLSGLGLVKESRVTAPEDAPGAVSAMLEIEQESWKYYRRSDMTSRGQQHVFYHHLCERLAVDGQLSLNFLRLNDEPVAYELDILLDGTVYSLKHSYKERFRKFSPGVILRSYSLRDYFELGFQSVNFWGSADRFKHLWTDERVPHYRLTLFRPSRVGVLAQWSSALRNRWNGSSPWVVLNNFFVGPVNRVKMKSPPPGQLSKWLRRLWPPQTARRRGRRIDVNAQGRIAPPPGLVFKSLGADESLPATVGAVLAHVRSRQDDLTPSCFAFRDGVAVAGVVARREPDGLTVLGCYIHPAFRCLELISAMRQSFLSRHLGQELFFEEHGTLPSHLSFELLE